MPQTFSRQEGIMLSLLWKFFLGILFPGGLIFLTAIGFLRPQGLPLWLHQPIAALPYIVLTFGLIFGWHFASSRMILSLLVLALADRALVMFPAGNVEQGTVDRTIVAMTAFFLPLNLLAFSIFKEDSFSTWRVWWSCWSNPFCCSGSAFRTSMT